MRLIKNDEAQTSLDFLIGITLFLLVFIFVFAFIPRMFAPFETNSDELTMTSDRAAQVLVENLLIDDQHVDSRIENNINVIKVYQGADMPGIINKQYYDNFKTALSDPAKTIQIKKTLGLGDGKTPESYYHLAIVISTEANPQGEFISPDPDITDSDDIVGTNVGQSKRFVYIHDPTVPIDTYTMAIITVRVW